MAAQGSPTLITSVRRAFRLMERVGVHAGGAPAKQLARETGMPLATTYHLLRTLVHDGYVTKLEDGGYVLGDRLDALHAGGRGQALMSRVRPVLASLRDGLSAAAYLTFYEDGEIRIAEIVDGPRTPRVDLWVGFEDAGHATALGKSVLRTLDEESRSDYLSRHPLADLTPRTITHADELLRHLEAAPAAPVVTDLEEYALGTVCAAVPVSDGVTIGSLGVSFGAPSQAPSGAPSGAGASSGAGRVSPLQRAGPRLISTAERVTRALSLTI